MKKKSCFYFLPESFPLKHVSENLKKHLLHIEVHQSDSAETQGADICNKIFDPKDVPDTNEVQKFSATDTNNQISHRRNIRKRKKNTAADSNCGKEVQDSPQKESCSETISVSSIIKRYFTNYDEVTSSSREFEMSLPFMTGSTPPQILDQHWTKSSRCTNEKNIGKRLIAASDNIGAVHLSKKSPTLSLCKFRNRNPFLPDFSFSTSSKDLVFDIPDEGD